MMITQCRPTMRRTTSFSSTVPPILSPDPLSAAPLGTLHGGLNRPGSRTTQAHMKQQPTLPPACPVRRRLDVDESRTALAQ